MDLQRMWTQSTKEMANAIDTKHPIMRRSLPAVQMGAEIPVEAVVNCET